MTKLDTWERLAAVASSALGDDPVTHDAITSDWRILQRRRGHRYSLDDLCTAFQAAQAKPGARRHLDLGCGIGSVLLMVGWRLETARGVGIEALEMSASLARRSIEGNDADQRLTVVDGDHRIVTEHWEEAPFDLVTGTPPYLPQGTALASPDPQRAAARIELRGGVEDYLASAARVVSADGVVVVCADGRRPERVRDGAARAGLSILHRRDVWPHRGASHPLLSVFTLSRAANTRPTQSELLVRDADGRHTQQTRAMRDYFGLGDR